MRVKPIGKDGRLMISNTKDFAHCRLRMDSEGRVKHSAGKGFRNVTGYFQFKVKLLLNWKSGFVSGRSGEVLKINDRDKGIDGCNR